MCFFFHTLHCLSWTFIIGTHIRNVCTHAHTLHHAYVVYADDERILILFFILNHTTIQQIDTNMFASLQYWCNHWRETRFQKDGQRKKKCHQYPLYYEIYTNAFIMSRGVSGSIDTSDYDQQWPFYYPIWSFRIWLSNVIRICIWICSVLSVQCEMWFICETFNLELERVWNVYNTYSFIIFVKQAYAMKTALHSKPTSFDKCCI